MVKQSATATVSGHHRHLIKWTDEWTVLPQTYIDIGLWYCLSMDKLKLTGPNMGRVVNSRLGCACASCAIANITKWPSLKLKTWPKQLLGFLPLAFALPGLSFCKF